MRRVSGKKINGVDVIISGPERIRGEREWLKEPRKEFSYVIPTLGRLRQENGEFKDSLNYIVRHCLRKTKRIREVHVTETRTILLREGMQSERILQGGTQGIDTQTCFLPTCTYSTRMTYWLNPNCQGDK